MDQKKLASRFVPIIRRGVAGDEKADTVRVFALEAGEPEVEIFTMPLAPKDDPEEVADFAASSALDESESSGADRVRLTCEYDGATLCEVVIRIRTKKQSADVVGNELLPRGESKEMALTRQAMRQAETFGRMLSASIDRREAAMDRREQNMVGLMEAFARGNTDMARTHFEFVKKHAETVQQDNASKVALIEADAKAEKVKELIGLVRSMTPRLMAKVMGDDSITPMIDILARLTPENADMMVAAGFITAAEKDIVLKTAEKARKATAKNTKALPGIASNTPGNGKAS